MNLLFQSIKSITVPELKEKLLENPALLDVRTPAEYRVGHIKGAKNVPLQSINRYDGDKEKTVYVICQSGMRSKQAAKELKKSGYDVVNVRGGMNQWFDRTVGGK
ncbi:rhodanese-like domain-containing protein [Enterococcus faecium]|uniref:rhodanese-like domain-containing protein n=1 Tax=Enterococcus faecium TaxID=1352 RepID=UPI001D7797AA|nr:rhodanese-like domain-containing protein [Enterococcus faecium]MDQ8369480.1 rhodanese-like domain-containing protein [Enterococcus faecium]HAQ6079323.1 rhodanese-like domain-containing protein [Enterococcus faecium]